MSNQANPIKQKIYDECIRLLDEKIHDLEAALKDLTSGAENDSKSSAGDKHETSRAMMQIEYEKIGKQLQEVRSQKVLLEKIDITTPSEKVRKGSLIKTDKGYLFLSVAIGKITIDGHTVIVLSPESPLGQKLTGLQANAGAEMNGTRYSIENVS